MTAFLAAGCRIYLLRFTKEVTRLDYITAARQAFTMYVMIALIVFALAAISDYLETRYVQAVHAWEAGDVRARGRAAHASFLMWLVGVVGFIAIIDFGWWVLAPEGAGLYLGTMLALRR